MHRLLPGSLAAFTEMTLCRAYIPIQSPMMSQPAFRNSPSSKSEKWLAAVIFSEGTRCAHLIPGTLRHQASVHILRLPSAMYSSYSLAVRGYGLLARLQRGGSWDAACFRIYLAADVSYMHARYGWRWCMILFFLLFFVGGSFGAN